ncbi:spermatogenesis-associated protein 4 isoform X2 [Larimichthys crocea]|uniref:spermatogenesis-associated protein 4 isoform X2 n=1 Tax=Larimichthys crocea TaxID=215358 RepID=UPI00054C05A7|nr:spermatogenesis-associated protein 4 isoform X2 [Larimichthys crocea]
MSYAQSPKKTGLPREVVKWLQSLDLSVYPKNVRRDLSSGYLVAEMFSHYYPQDFPMHSYDKGASLSTKQRNWSQIQRSLQKHHLHLMKEVIDGTIHCKPGAAELMVQEVYTVLTKRSIRNIQSPESDFTDDNYQELLPTVARSTASTAIKNNLRITEIMAVPDVSTNRRKAEVILHRHLRHKAAGRVLSPGQFKVKHDLGHLAATPVSSICESCSSSPAWSRADVSFKEIKVHQPVRRSVN